MAGRFFPQERECTCAVAALRSVLASQFGVVVPEYALRFAGDRAALPIVRYGSGPIDIRRMLSVADRARNTGPRWKLRARWRGTIAQLARELRAGRFPMAAVARVDGMHMVVVNGYEPGRVRYYDPATGRSRWRGAAQFRREWLDEEARTWYAVITGGAA